MKQYWLITLGTLTLGLLFPVTAMQRTASLNRFPHQNVARALIAKKQYIPSTYYSGTQFSTLTNNRLFCTNNDQLESIRNDLIYANYQHTRISLSLPIEISALNNIPDEKKEQALLSLKNSTYLHALSLYELYKRKKTGTNLEPVKIVSTHNGDVKKAYSQEEYDKKKAELQINLKSAEFARFWVESAAYTLLFNSTVNPLLQHIPVQDRFKAAKFLSNNAYCHHLLLLGEVVLRNSEIKEFENASLVIEHKEED